MSEEKISWTLEEAFNLISTLKQPLYEAGWAIGLTGSIITNYKSSKDLDIILFPKDCSNINHEKFREVLRKEGLVIKWTRSDIVKFWSRKSSKDTKHVEVWYFGDKRVDIFVLS